MLKSAAAITEGLVDLYLGNISQNVGWVRHTHDHHHGQPVAFRPSDQPPPGELE